MTRIEIEFPEHQISVRAELLEKQAPITTTSILQILSNESIETTGKHAMYTGKEISVQFSEEVCSDSGLSGDVKENLTCFPQPGDLLFTYMPAYAWGGVPSQIFDIGIFYGRDARTFFPMGWLPGNHFAKVISEDLEKLADIGSKTLLHGQQKVIIRKVND
ncbi:DUF3830 family protein [Sporosarcina sp. OR05]|uniref:DUF3830 family protein n=1 Tax=Sporosarcina sp. OR05 TaxID=2969819 RepID=UPI00352B86D4